MRSCVHAFQQIFSVLVNNRCLCDFQVALEDGTVLDKSVKESEELGQEDVVIPAIFTLGYGQVIPGWELGITGMCLG